MTIEQKLEDFIYLIISQNEDMPSSELSRKLTKDILFGGSIILNTFLDEMVEKVANVLHEENCWDNGDYISWELEDDEYVKKEFRNQAVEVINEIKRGLKSHD